MTSYFHKRCALLEPGALLPILRYPFTYTIPADKTVYLLASWGTRLGSSGLVEVRDPHEPMALRGVTLTGYKPGASAILLNPDIPAFPDAQSLYYERMNAIDEMPVHTVPFEDPSQYKPMLTGAYGAIITRVVNRDFNWIIAGQGDTMYNLANEIGDTPGESQRTDNAMRLVCDKRTISQVASSAQRTTGYGAYDAEGSVNYGLLPASWSVVPDPLTYVFRDDFMQPVLDTGIWNRVQTTGGNVEIDSLYQWLKLKGNGAWGTNGIRSAQSFERGRSLIVDIYPGRTPTTTNLLIGWNDGIGVDYPNFPHSVNFGQSGLIQVHEAGVNKGTVGAWEIGRIYRMKITTLADGAIYEIQGGDYPDIGGETWQTLTPSGSAGTAPLYLGASQLLTTNNTYISDYRVV